MICYWLTMMLQTLYDNHSHHIVTFHGSGRPPARSEVKLMRLRTFSRCQTRQQSSGLTAHTAV